MIPVSTNPVRSDAVRVWLATGHTDMRRGFPGLALLVQETLGRDPFAGDLFIFRGRRGDLIKVIWHDGQGACLFSKRLERGRFIWPTALVSPLALEAVRRIDALFEIERGINGKSPDERRAVRQDLSRPLVGDLETWMRAERPKLSRGSDVAKAMDYMLKRWPAFTRFIDDGRVCLSNNAAERGLRGIALGRKSWLFAGSDRGGERAAAMYSLIVTAKLNDIDPQAWLADVLARIAGHPASKLDELLPWNWQSADANISHAA